jgi:hypothetical protein
VKRWEEFADALKDWGLARALPNNCRRCGIPYSDWFTWPPGGRYCYICWGPDKWTGEPPPSYLFARGEEAKKKAK